MRVRGLKLQLYTGAQSNYKLWLVENQELNESESCQSGCGGEGDLRAA